MKVLGTLRFLLLLIIVVFNCAISGFVMYSENNNQCKCGPEWRRFILKYGGFIISAVAILAYFTPIIAIIKMIPIIGGLFLLAMFGLCVLMIYCTQKYLDDLKSDDCECKDKGKILKLSVILGWTSTTTLIITALVIVAIIFYLF